MTKQSFSLLLLAAFCLFAAGCTKKADPADPSNPVPTVQEGGLAPSSSGSQEIFVDGGSSEEGSWEEVSSQEYDSYLKKYVVPYGNLKFFQEDWTDPEQLGADRIFLGAMQIVFHRYQSPMDYLEVFGEDFLPLEVPESWADPTYGCIYPQDLVENGATEYFGVSQDFLRTSSHYIPAKNGYAFLEPDMPDSEWIPVVIGVQRNGDQARITFELYEASEGFQASGEAVAIRVMTVCDKTESFRYLSVVNQ